MTKVKKQGLTSATLVVVLLVIDQVIKILVKSGMPLHSSIKVADWFYIYFTENNGMAFGMELTPKLFLSCFRLLAICWGVWYMMKLIRSGINWGFLICCSFVLAGAIGNIIDCLFYGLIFNQPFDGVPAHFVPFGEGYESLFHGRVVDMFYFPLVEWNWPQWMPLVGGDHFIFFSPIFNFADACISCGIIYIILFYRKQLAKCMGSDDNIAAQSDATK